MSKVESTALWNPLFLRACVVCEESCLLCHLVAEAAQIRPPIFLVSYSTPIERDLSTNRNGSFGAEGGLDRTSIHHPPDV